MDSGISGVEILGWTCSSLNYLKLKILWNISYGETCSAQWISRRHPHLPAPWSQVGPCDEFRKVGRDLNQQSQVLKHLKEGTWPWMSLFHWGGGLEAKPPRWGSCEKRLSWGLAWSSQPQFGRNCPQEVIKSQETTWRRQPNPCIQNLWDVRLVHYCSISRSVLTNTRSIQMLDNSAAAVTDEGLVPEPNGSSTI